MSLEQELRALGMAVRAESAPASVEAAVLKAFRRRQRRPKWRLASGAIAAAVMWGAWWLAPAKEARLIVSVPHIQAPVFQARHEKAPEIKRVVRRRRPVRRVQQPEREFATDFMPLPFADPSPVERGEVVRVQLPRSVALQWMGLAAQPTSLGARVKADVVLGEDGFARAVRFVQ